MLPILDKSIKLSLQNYEKKKKVPLTPEGGTQKTSKRKMHFITFESTSVVLAIAHGCSQRMKDHHNKGISILPH